MRPRLPPLNALKAFEAAARHESFTRAAEELCVTQGAVSHQVKALEAELAIKLFNRERQRLIITEAGKDYLTVVRDALDRIAVGTERLLAASERRRSHRQYVARFCCQVARASAWPFRGCASGHRLAGFRNAASRRLCAGGGRPRRAPRRR
jgi:DNA-binding transcriptional LysR family regulator